MASISYEYDCDKSTGFVMNPNEHKRVGYVTSLAGFGMSGLAQDLVVLVPFNGNSRPLFEGFQYQATGPATSAKVIGVLEKFTWAGGAGDAIKLDFYVSQENAFQIKSLQQTAMKSAKINSLAWWVGDYDQETKVWFEQCYPRSGPISGVLMGGANPELNVDLTPVAAKDGIDVMVYKISLSVVPGANLSYQLVFSNSSRQKAVKAWGLVVGTLASARLS
jgi:hypothetical protein